MEIPTDNHRKLLDLIKYPIITDKTTKYIEENKYCFAVEKNASKPKIKQAIEYIFNVKIININTLNTPIKKKRVGKFMGKLTNHKKAIIELDSQDTINLFEE
uniref:Large ribosomal subunit protein uL23c n=1 Tax=Antithamnionella ternifolia TaxID=207919 RepID=A0A4D6WK95_9FLOR|nr:ribosomal protein L23 [Antithamnionella ternifolia]